MVKLNNVERGYSWAIKTLGGNQPRSELKAGPLVKMKFMVQNEQRIAWLALLTTTGKIGLDPLDGPI